MSAGCVLQAPCGRRVLFEGEEEPRGAQVVVVSPDYNNSAIHADLWIHPRPGTDAALALDWFRRGADYIETMAVGELLSHPLFKNPDKP